MIRHLPQNTHSEGISDGLVDLGFDVISVDYLKKDLRERRNLNIYSNFHAPVTYPSRQLRTGHKMPFHTTRNFAVSGQIASNRPTICGAGVGHLYKDCPQKVIGMWGDNHVNIARPIKLWFSR
jgi:hypothetical protein